MTEYKHRLIHKESFVVHLAKRDRPDGPMYRTLCNLRVSPKWRKSKIELGYGNEEITCRRCLKKMEAER